MRILNTNVDGRRKVVFALTAIKGVGRRFATVCCIRANVDLTKRAGELSKEEIDRVVAILQSPLEYKVPVYMLNRQRDYYTGENRQLVSNMLSGQFRTDMARLRKMRVHRGIRHFWGLKVRGQHTCTTGRRGRSVGK